jgi:hypothetical protein
MPLSPFPDKNTPPARPGIGCLGKFLILCFAFALAIPASLFVIAFHTALPLTLAGRTLEAVLEKQQFRIEGIGGSLSSGFRFKSARWQGGQILDFSIRYTNFLWNPRNGIRIGEIRFSKFHVQMRGRTTAENSQTEPGKPASNLGSPTEKPQFGGVQIEHAELKDIRIMDPETGLDLAVDLLELGQFSAGPGGMSIGQLKLLSDRLELKSHAERDSGALRLDATLLPKLHPGIRKPLPVTLIASTVPPTHPGTGQLVHFIYPPGGDPFLLTDQLDVRPFLDFPVPGNLTCRLPLATPKNPGSPEFSASGSFELGSLRFHVAAPKAQSQSELFGRAVDPEGELLYSLSFNQQRLQQSLESVPPQKPEELVARIFFAKSFASLSPTEQEEASRLRSFFKFPQTPDPDQKPAP